MNASGPDRRLARVVRRDRPRLAGSKEPSEDQTNREAGPTRPKQPWHRGWLRNPNHSFQVPTRQPYRPIGVRRQIVVGKVPDQIITVRQAAKESATQTPREIVGEFTKKLLEQISYHSGIWSAFLTRKPVRPNVCDPSGRLAVVEQQNTIQRWHQVQCET